MKYRLLRWGIYSLIFVVVMLGVFLLSQSNTEKPGTEVQTIKFIEQQVVPSTTTPSNNRVVPIIQGSAYYALTSDGYILFAKIWPDVYSYASNYEDPTGAITGAVAASFGVEGVSGYSPITSTLGRIYIKKPEESGLFGPMGKSLHMHMSYYPGTSGEPYRIPILVIDYLYHNNNDQTYDIVNRLLAYVLNKDGTVSATLNVWHDIDLEVPGYTISISDPSSVYIRSYIMPYTELEPVGAYNNAINRILVFTTFTDDNGLYSYGWSTTLSGTTDFTGYFYQDLITIPLAYLYTQDRSGIYVVLAGLSTNNPSELVIDYAIFDSTFSFASATTITTINLPAAMANPDLFVYYMSDHVVLVPDGQGNFVTNTPIRIALYSPTAQRIVYVDISLKFTPVDSSTYNVEVTSASVSQTIDVSAITGGDVNKAMMLNCDLTSPKAKVYGLYCFRTTELDGQDPFYNSPFSIVFYRFSGGTWSEVDELDVFPRAKKDENTYYLYPKAKVLYRTGFVDGIASILELEDVQYLSDDGSTNSGIMTSWVKIVPHKEYDIVPTKFTLSVTYDYYITPITITYTKADPSEPDTLTNVLVPIEITDTSVIVTQDARDVRFFTTNDYGGDYWQYDGLTYAVKEMDSNHAVFYVLIPSITADTPLTIYMYSGFQYASPVAHDYYSLISTYPILTTQS